MELHIILWLRGAVQAYPAVLSGPNCLAGEAEIQGFLLEAERTPDTQIKLVLAAYADERLQSLSLKKKWKPKRSGTWFGIRSEGRGPPGYRGDMKGWWEKGEETEKERHREKTTFLLLINPRALRQRTRWGHTDGHSVAGEWKDDTERSQIHQHICLSSETLSWFELYIYCLCAASKHESVCVCVCVCTNSLQLPHTLPALTVSWFGLRFARRC